MTRTPCSRYSLSATCFSDRSPALLARGWLQPSVTGMSWGQGAGPFRPLWSSALNYRETVLSGCDVHLHAGFRKPRAGLFPKSPGYRTRRPVHLAVSSRLAVYPVQSGLRTYGRRSAVPLDSRPVCPVLRHGLSGYTRNASKLVVQAFRRQWSTQQIALHTVAADGLEEVQLVLALYTFGYRHVSHSMREVNK